MSTIEPRYGAEVYIGQRGHVCIKQVRFDADEEGVVILHRDEVPELVELLLEHRQKALDFVPETDPDGCEP